MKTLSLALAIFGLTAAQASADTYGIATMSAGSLSYRTGAAIAKVATEKAGLRTLVQAMAGETVLIPMVGKNVVQFGLANIVEYLQATHGNGHGGMNKLRLIGAVQPLRLGVFSKKGSSITTISDLRGKRIPTAPATLRSGVTIRKALFAFANLTEEDVKSVLVANPLRGVDAFIQGKVDAFSFAFGAPKLREVNLAVGGIQALKIEDTPEAMAASRRNFQYGYLSEIVPSEAFVGVPQPMKVYTIDLVLFTNADVRNEVVYKLIAAIVANKAELVAIAPNLRGLSAKELNKKYDLEYHPGALKYFVDHNVSAQEFK